MRISWRGCLIGLLVASLVEAPVMAAPSRPLGVVLQADHARVGAAEAAGGTTIFSGDTLTTDASGTLRVRLGGTQLYLLSNSAAALAQSEAGVSATLQRGTVVLSSSGTSAVELRTSEARIRPKTAGPTLAQVSYVGPYEFLVTSQRGALEVTIDNEVHVVSEATSYRVTIDPEPAQKKRGAGAAPAPAARSRFLLIALILIGVGTGVGIWRALVSPSHP